MSERPGHYIIKIEHGLEVRLPTGHVKFQFRREPWDSPIITIWECTDTKQLEYGELSRLPGNYWLADPNVEASVLIAALPDFRRLWGPFLVRGTSDKGRTVCPETYSRLTDMLERLKNARELEIREKYVLLHQQLTTEERFVVIELENGRPGDEHYVRNKADLERFGWDIVWVEQMVEFV